MPPPGATIRAELGPIDGPAERTAGPTLATDRRAVITLAETLDLTLTAPDPVLKVDARRLVGLKQLRTMLFSPDGKLLATDLRTVTFDAATADRVALRRAAGRCAPRETVAGDCCRRPPGERGQVRPLLSRGTNRRQAPGQCRGGPDQARRHGVRWDPPPGDRAERRRHVRVDLRGGRHCHALRRS